MSRTLTEFYNEFRLDISDKTDGTLETADMKRLLNRAITRRQNQEDFLVVKDRTIFEAFDTVYEYAVPTGFKAIVDFYDVNGRIETDKVTADNFWDRKHDPDDIILTAVDGFKGTRTLLFKEVSNDSINISGLTDTTENGTWSIGGDGGSLFEDTNNYVYGNASLRFTVTPSANTTTLTNSTLAAIDLSESKDLSTLLLQVYLPVTSGVTSVKLSWGDSASAYWHYTATAQASGAAFQVGWNVIAFPWASATQVGSPSASSVNYAVITLAHTFASATAGFRVNWLRSATPHIYDLHYYSVNAVKTNADVFQAVFVSDDDTTVWDDDFDDIILKDAEVDAFGKNFKDDKMAETCRAEAEAMMAKAIVKEPSEQKWIITQQ
jgi:hypothetical protein